MRKNIEKTKKEEADSRSSEGTQQTERRSKTMDGNEEKPPKFHEKRQRSHNTTRSAEKCK